MSWLDFPITHGFIPSYTGPGTDTPHYADDIGTPFHTPLTALLSGTVVQADYAAWGGEIFIKPDDPSYPEYYMYHPDLLEVSKGQHVAAGQEIALSGGENPGYPGAEHPAQPQWSTGPHTHVGFFTNWNTSTPQGTVPYGPDITPLIMAIKTGKITLPPSTGGSPAASGSTTGSTQQASWSTALPDTLLKVGLFLVALILVGAGLYALFQKQIDSGVSKGINVAKVAML
jgi:murein DD-endopeptidase MepM/ murein hydrolase activator NlpD